MKKFLSIALVGGLMLLISCASPSQVSDLQKKVGELEAQITALQEKVDALSQTIEGLTQASAQGVTAAQFAKVSSDVQTLKTKVADLEGKYKELRTAVDVLKRK